MTELKGETAPALGISLNAQFAAGRQVVFQTHVAQETAPEEINRLLDKMNAAVDRQEAFYRIEELENALERDKQILYSITHNMENVEQNMQLKYEARGKRGEFKLSPQEAIQKKQAQDNLVRQTEIVKLAEKRLADAKEKAGNRDGAPSPANS